MRPCSFADAVEERRIFWEVESWQRLTECLSDRKPFDFNQFSRSDDVFRQPFECYDSQVAKTGKGFFPPSLVVIDDGKSAAGSFHPDRRTRFQLVCPNANKLLE